MPEIILKPGREKSVLRHHPWIYSGAVSRLSGEPKVGETVNVLSSHDDFLAKAAFNPNSNIIGRIWTWDETQPINEQYFEDKLSSSLQMREVRRDLINSDAFRLVHAESDGIPGLILDRYHDVFVVEFLTAGVDYWKDVISEAIIRLTGAEVLYERSDQDVRLLEGLNPHFGFLHGKLNTEEVLIKENGISLSVNFVTGHKTGFYLDQRDNRAIAGKISHGLNILDCFSYTGGFAINSLTGDAKHVTLVDSSDVALRIANENAIRNNIDIRNIDLVEQDVFHYLRSLRDGRKKFDMVILDPPKFAPTVAQVERASRAYKDINLLAMKLLRSGGYLVTFSCSGGVSEDLFQKIVAGAAQDADADMLILQRLHQAFDHPVALNFPEGAYLKGFVLQRRN